eukprot:303942_1
MAESPPAKRVAKRPIILFDVDGTLTVPRNKATDEMIAILAQLRKKYTIGMVGGSDLPKQKEQLGDNLLEMFDYVFAENGLTSYKDGKPFHSQSIVSFLGDDKLNAFVSYVMEYLARLQIPKKRGTFIEARTGLINVSPIGRNCSQQEREEYETFDKANGIRTKMVAELTEKFGESFGLHFSIGGQISFDVFPKGWDKTYCLRFLE